MGPMFEQYFRNATLLVLEDPESGSTLLDISRVMADAEYRAAKLAKATNPVVVEFWQKIATQAGGEAALENIVPYITNKFDDFTANDFVRPIIGQQHSSFNFREVIDSKKILLVNLSKGRLGEGPSHLLGSLLLSHIALCGLERADRPAHVRTPFFVYLDEFQTFATPMLATMLSELRKYRLGLNLAHQYLSQLDPVVRDAVLGNVGSLITFRLGPADAPFLAHEFEPTFSSSNLLELPNYHMYLKLMVDGAVSKPFSATTIPSLGHLGSQAPSSPARGGI